MTAPIVVTPQDIASGTILDNITYESVTWGKTISDATDFNLTVPAGTKSAANLDELRRYIYIRQDKRVLYDGICWTTANDLPAHTKRASGSDLWSYLGARLVRNKLGPYTALEQFTIVANLLTELAADGGDLGITLRRNPTNSGTARTQTYESWERKPFDEAIADLGEADNGFEFITSATYSGGTFQRWLDLWSPLLGKITPTTWIHGRDVNVTQIVRDGTRAGNRIDAIGAGSDVSKIISTAVGTLQARPRLDGTISRTDVTDTGFLDALAAGELARVEDPVVTYDVEILRTDRLGEWGPGDQVWLVIRDKANGINEAGYVRIESYKATATPDGVTATATLAKGVPVGRPLLSPARQFTADQREQARILARLVRT